MKTFTLQKVAIVTALIMGSATIAGSAMAASSHSRHPGHVSTTRMKQECKEKSWEIPTQTQGTPEMATACAMHGS
jgi:hypothetical protein